MDFSDEIPGFLIESAENLSLLDSEMVKLEKDPSDEALIASVFRTIHTIKGTSGFFGFTLLGSVTHVAENILGQVREKQRTMTPELVSLILRSVDAVRLILLCVEATGNEGPDEYEPLRNELNAAFQSCVRSANAPAPTRSVGQHTVTAQPVVPEPAMPAQPAPTAEAIPVQPPAAKAPVAETTDPPHNRRADDGALANSTIRVDVSLLDKLMNLVGELVLARNQILQGATQSIGGNATSQRLNLITSELQEGVMRTRMQPIGTVWSKLPRVVRDLAAELGKKIELHMQGADTELDKTIIEAIKDPLTHIVRNSCDHGVESPETRLGKGKPATGAIALRAFHEGGHVNIEISDDGAGLDPEKLKTKAIQKGLIRAEQAARLSDWEAHAMTGTGLSDTLSPENYKFLQEEIYRGSGIIVDADKHYLLEARLTPILRSAGIATLSDLCTRLRSRLAPSLNLQVIEAMTTNETLFFRDMGPFEAMQQRLLPEFKTSLSEHEPLRIWSAAASSGQEAYSIAMLLHEQGWQNRSATILGTDISEQILNVARAAKYGQFEVNRGLPAMYLVKYFTREGNSWLLKPDIANMAQFRQFDLRQPTSALGRFHIIFCRNVLIYFDQETKHRILLGLWSALQPGGYLILGGAESILHLQDRFDRIPDCGTPLYRRK